MRDLGVGEEEICDLKAEENVELKHEGLDNEGFGSEGWVDLYLGINIFRERVGRSIRQIPFDNPLLYVDCNGCCSVGDFFGGQRW